jgi:nitrogen fixation/metabolism regulation signal transduction histidine kinase
MAQYKRRKRLIKPRLQLKLTFIFVSLSALSLLLQFILFSNRLTNVALELPHDSAYLLQESNGLLLQTLLSSFLLFLPLTFIVGVLTTFRIAGPLHRFETFLRAVRRGERPADFRLRQGDELQELAELLNVVTGPLRSAQTAPDSAGAPDLAAPLPREQSHLTPVTDGA